MMVLKRSATVSSFNSGYDRPLATDGSPEQHAADHGLRKLCQGSQKQHTGYNMKSVQSSFLPNASK